MLLEREAAAPNTANKNSRKPLPKLQNVDTLEQMLLKRFKVSQDITTTNPAGRTASAQTLKKQQGRNPNRRSESPRFIPRSAGIIRPTAFFPG